MLIKTINTFFKHFDLFQNNLVYYRSAALYGGYSQFLIFGRAKYY